MGKQFTLKVSVNQIKHHISLRKGIQQEDNLLKANVIKN